MSPNSANGSTACGRDRCSESVVHAEDARNRKRRELCDLLERFYFSDDGTAGLLVDDEDVLSLHEFASDEHSRLSPPPQDQTTCVFHPRVRRRNDRCPLCAAESARDSKWRHSTGSAGSLEGLRGTSSHDGSPAGAGELEVMAHQVLSPRSDESNEHLDYSTDQLLDPKWADALRQISARLSSSRSSNSLGDAIEEEREVRQEERLRSSRSLASMDQVCLSQEDSLHPLPPRLPPQCTSYIGSLTQLRQVVEMATRSVGRFTPSDDCADLFLLPGEQGIDEEEDDNLSLSSMARSDRRNFAESKGRIFPVNQRKRQEGNRRCLNSEKAATGDSSLSDNSTGEMGCASILAPQEQETPCGAFSQYPPTVIRIGPDTVSRSFSGSDSSLTFSLSSKESLGSSSSSSLVVGSSGGGGAYVVSCAAASAALVSKQEIDHTNSPTSVLDQMPSNQSTSSSPRLPCNSLQEQEDKDSIPFGPPFTSSATAVSDLKWNSDRKESHLPNSKPQDSPSFVRLEEVLVEDVDSDSEDDEATVVAEDITTPPQARTEIIENRNHMQEPLHAPHTASSRPTRMESSFITALVQNARARSRSRSRARSRSKSRRRKSSNSISQNLNESTSSTSTVVAAAEAVAENESIHYRGSQDETLTEPPLQVEPGQDRNEESCLDSEVEHRIHCHEVDTELVIPARKEQEPPTTTRIPTHDRVQCPPRTVNHVPPPPPGIRGPIVHPRYKLGDIAREEDMIVFPSSKSRKSRRSRRSRRHESDDDNSSDDEGHHRRSSSVKDLIIQAIGQLSHLDAAFVRRSDGSWTYALVADGNENEIRFVVNDRGSTKSFPKSLWGSSVRRIRVLTQRQGDRFLYKDDTTNPGARRKRSISRGRSRSKGKGRLVSPSPTRRNNSVLNIPATIMEEVRPRSKRYEKKESSVVSLELYH